MGYMGSEAISVHIPKWIEKYNLSTFVETGLERGRSLAHMKTYPGLKKFISIEIDKRYIDLAEKQGLEIYPTEERLPVDDTITLLHGSSTAMLPEALNLIEGNAIWWLDAHLPKLGGKWKEGIATMEDILVPRVAGPLEQELDIILSRRDMSNDVLIIDDLRLYKPGYRKFLGDRGYEDFGTDVFIFQKLEPLFDIVRSSSDSGYAIATPKDK